MGRAVLNVKAVVAAFNQEKALVEAFSVIVQLHWLIVYSTSDGLWPAQLLFALTLIGLSIVPGPLMVTPDTAGRKMECHHCTVGIQEEIQCS